MKYSIIVPYYDPQYVKTHLITECLKSIVENSKGQDYELVIVKDGPSYVESHNIGLSNAKGDYLVVVNDDIIIEDPEWLQKLTQDDGISAWKIGEFHLAPIPMPQASCFCFSRPTFLRLGLMDEAYKHGKNYEDTDYFLRARDLKMPFYDAQIKLSHVGNQTLGTYFEDLDTEINRKVFFQKWKM